MRTGTLFCIIGPRGTGKDSIIEGAKHRLVGDRRFVFPRRIITPAGYGGGGVVHQSVTPAQFESLRRDGAFALHWFDCGVGYAISRGIEHDLDAGRAVVVHLARQVVPAARRQYGRVSVIEVRAPVWLVAERLARKDLIMSPEERRRLAGQTDDDADHLIRDDGALDTAVDRLVRVLCAQGAEPPLRIPGRQADASSLGTKPVGGGP